MRSIIPPMSEHLAQTVNIETPELVVVSYTVAGLGSRVYAALIDLALCFTAMLAVLLLFTFIAPAGTAGLSGRERSMSTAWAFAILTIFQFVILWGYYLLLEGLNDGQTLGKRLLGLRAVRDGG